MMLFANFIPPVLYAFILPAQYNYVKNKYKIVATIFFLCNCDRMTDNLNDLQKRIQTLKADTQPLDATPAESVDAEAQNDKQGLGAAYELIMTPIVCGSIGLGLDKLFSTAPVFFITLAILGLLAGFWRIYRVSQNIHTPLELKRLQQKQKQGRTAQISDKNAE